MSSEQEDDGRGFSAPIDESTGRPGVVCDQANERWVVEYGAHNGRTPSEAIIQAVGEITDAAPEDLEPLFYSIDVDAVDRLFDPEGKQDSGDASLTFEYEGFCITVRRGGSIFIDSQTA